MKAANAFMGKRMATCLGIALCYAVLMLSARGAMDMFLKIEGISGESDDTQHQDWIEILSYSHGVSQPAGGISSVGGARSAGRVDHDDFAFVKELDKATPLLNLNCCSGTHITKATLEVFEAGTTPRRIYVLELYDVIVTAVRPSGSVDDNRPIEDVTLNYGRIAWIYTEYDISGHGTDIETGWDVTTNQER